MLTVNKNKNNCIFEHITLKQLYDLCEFWENDTEIPRYNTLNFKVTKSNFLDKLYTSNFFNK